MHIILYIKLINYDPSPQNQSQRENSKLKFLASSCRHLVYLLKTVFSFFYTSHITKVTEFSISQFK